MLWQVLCALPDVTIWRIRLYFPSVNWGRPSYLPLCYSLLPQRHHGAVTHHTLQAHVSVHLSGFIDACNSDVCCRGASSAVTLSGIQTCGTLWTSHECRTLLRAFHRHRLPTRSLPTEGSPTPRTSKWDQLSKRNASPVLVRHTCLESRDLEHQSPLSSMLTAFEISATLSSLTIQIANFLNLFVNCGPQVTTSLSCVVWVTCEQEPSKRECQ